MTARSHREFLMAQLADMRRLLESVSGHRLMAASYASRVRELEHEIAAIPEGVKEPKATLMFSGAPVQGSMGIDLAFAGDVMEPFQSMVDADYASQIPNAWEDENKLPGAENSRLLLTALPRGSFGLELIMADDGQKELFEGTQLADSLTRVTELMGAAAQSDEIFDATIEKTHPSVLAYLRKLLKVIKRGRAGVKIESGDARCIMSPAKVAEAYARVASVVKEVNAVRMIGIFRGILLNSRSFNFTPASGPKIRGRVDKKMSDSRAEALNREFSNKECVGIFLKAVSTQKGKERVSYQLQDIHPMSADGKMESSLGDPINDDWI